MLSKTLLIAFLAFTTCVLAAPATEAVTIPEAAPAVAARATYLGGLDMPKVCRDQYGSNSESYVKQYDLTCGAWSCTNGHFNQQYLNVDMPAACARRYGQGVYAWCEKGMYDWGCYRS